MVFLHPLTQHAPTSAGALVFPEHADYNQLALQILPILEALQCCRNFVGGCYKETRQTKKSNESSLSGWVHMTGCLTSNTDEVSKMGGGVENLWLALRRIYVRYYGNVTLNYEDSMERQDGMNYWCGAIWLFVLYIPNKPFVFCAQNLNPTSDKD